MVLIPPSLPLQIDRFTLVSWTVPPERLRERLPPALELETVSLPGQGERAILSIFVGRLRFSPLRFPLVSVTQLNYRTYVRHGPNYGIYFFRSLLSSLPLATAIRNAMGFPVYARRLTVRWRAEGQAEVKSDEVRLALRQGLSPRSLAGFADVGEGLEKLLRPLWGYWQRSDGRLGAMRVEHPTPEALSGELVAAWLPWLQESGILSAREATEPHSVLFVPRVRMGAYLTRETVLGEPSHPAPI